MKTLGGQEFAGSLKSDRGKTKGVAEERRNSAAQRMANNPESSGGVDGGDVAVYLEGVVVVRVLGAQLIFETGQRAAVRRGVAIADCFPRIRNTGTATGEEQIVVYFVTCRSLAAAKQDRAGALEGDDDSGVCRVDKDVAAQTVLLPAKVVGLG